MSQEVNIDPEGAFLELPQPHCFCIECEGMSSSTLGLSSGYMNKRCCQCGGFTQVRWHEIRTSVKGYHGPFAENVIREYVWQNNDIAKECTGIPNEATKRTTTAPYRADAHAQAERHPLGFTYKKAHYHIRRDAAYRVGAGVRAGGCTG